MAAFAGNISDQNFMINKKIFSAIVNDPEIFDISKGSNLAIFDIKNLFTNLKSIEEKLADPDMDLLAIYKRMDNVLSDQGMIGAFSTITENLGAYSGLSIYFPQTLDTAIRSFDFRVFYSPSEGTQSFFAMDSFWQEFLYFYLKYRSLQPQS